MKRASLLATLASISTFSAPPEQPRDIRNDPPYVSIGTAPSASQEKVVYEEQRAVTTGRPVLIAPEQANNLIARFKAAYPKLGSPRIVLYVNRELVDESSGLKLASRTERSQVNATEVKNEFKADPTAPQSSTTATVPTLPSPSNVTIVGDVSGIRHRAPGLENVNTRTEKSTHENTYKLSEKSSATLADKQTARDVERLFGRPLRMAGATLADQRVASQLLADRSLQELHGGNEQGRRDREALAKVADIAIEILISSRNVTASELSGENSYTVPDIQATALRLSDARVLGQATATDIIGKDRAAASVARNFDVREIAEATALALMEDMLLNVPE